MAMAALLILVKCSVEIRMSDTSITARMMSVMMYAVFYLFVGCNMYVSNHMSVGMLTSFFGKNTKYSSFGHRFPAFFFESDVI